LGDQTSAANVPGVTEINSIGGFAKEYLVSPQPEQLAAYGFTLATLVTALERNNTNVGAGYIERQGEQYLIRAPGQVKGIADIREVIVGSAQGQPIRIRDLADVGLGRELRTGAATDNGAKWCWGRSSCSSARTAVWFRRPCCAHGAD
jgi:cobalt-zinc-cadmium resistance protein CzcA